MERPDPNSDPTQEELILRRLRESENDWVPMPELMRCSGSANIHSRIAGLRAKGHSIQHRCEGARPRRSFYLLLSPVVSQSFTPMTP